MANGEAGLVGAWVKGKQKSLEEPGQGGREGEK